MIIESIKPVNKKRYQIITDEQLAFVLYKGELSRYRLEEGCELLPEVYQEIVEEILKKRAKLRAMHLLTAQDRTEFQLREKLGKDGHPKEVVDCAVDYVKSYHYIDDARYAESYVRSMQGRKSSRWISFELERKGISRTIIEQVMTQSEGVSEEGMIEALVRKRAGEPHKLDEKELRRLYGYLMRRGFRSQEIGSVLQRYQKC
ncbi:MAG TPA: regulatory protein RecX [Candidatus Pelethocola excrementipullorum]|nr:regulatory protein RecX [Candidatus Pelethocola excrementipullorum]